MSVQQFFIVLVALIAFSFVFNLWRINNRVQCRFTGRDRRVKKKWAKPVDGQRIEYKNGWYYVITKCLRLDSVFFGLLPLYFLEFTYTNKYPLNPDTGEPEEETPEMRKNLNKREDIQALELGSQRALGKGATTKMGGWLPIALVVGLAATLYLVYQMQGQIDSVGNALNVLQEMMMKSGMLK